MLRLLMLAACCFSSLIVSTTVNAHDSYSLQARVANSHYRHYVEYPRQLQLLEDSIRLQKAEIASLERRLFEWEPSDRFHTGRALTVTIENTRLVLLAAKLDLQRMEQQRFDLVRYRGRYRAW